MDSLRKGSRFKMANKVFKSGRTEGSEVVTNCHGLKIDAKLIREAVFQCRCDPAWHTHYSEEAKMAIANLNREMDKLFFEKEGKFEFCCSSCGHVEEHIINKPVRPPLIEITDEK